MKGGKVKIAGFGLVTQKEDKNRRRQTVVELHYIFLLKFYKLLEEIVYIIKKLMYGVLNSLHTNFSLGSYLGSTCDKKRKKWYLIYLNK